MGKVKTTIISGFPGIGKSYLFKNNKYLKIADSDSSKFSWLEEGVRNPDFPQNYIEHIKDCIGKYNIVLVSSHDIVRKALQDNGIEYAIYYPSIYSKEEYLNRYKERGSSEGFISIISKNWTEWIEEIEKETFPLKVKMDSGEYLSNRIRPMKRTLIKYSMFYCEDCQDYHYTYWLDGSKYNISEEHALELLSTGFYYLDRVR